jgi:hypothetical protein
LCTRRCTTPKHRIDHLERDDAGEFSQMTARERVTASTIRRVMTD